MQVQVEGIRQAPNGVEIQMLIQNLVIITQRLTPISKGPNKVNPTRLYRQLRPAHRKSTVQQRQLHERTIKISLYKKNIRIR